MDKRGYMMLKVLMNRYNPKASEALIRFLPKEEAQALASQEIQSADFMPILYQPHRLIQILHYSWILPLLAKFPERVRPIVLGALTPEQVDGLKTAIGSEPVKNISQPIRNFILNELYATLNADKHLPLDYLPETEISALARLTKKHLVMLIDYLGLYDLAAEIRSIVNKAHLKNLQDCLTPKQQYYLNVCLHQKDRIVSPKLGIDPSKQDCPKLKQILHRRGLLRLSNALSGQHPDLIWYVSHILDTGRGKILLQSVKPQAIKHITEPLKQQVVNVMNFLKKSEA